MRKYFLLFILFIGVLNYGQSLNITGKIVDQGNKPIEDATVYLLKQKIHLSLTTPTPEKKETLI